MHIALGQTRSLRGAIEKNTAEHLLLIERAHAHRAAAVFFPELSLTGYEPSLANQLAFTPKDDRLLVFQDAANQTGMVLGVGLPTVGDERPRISHLLFRPDGQDPLVYSKHFLHVDEVPFFEPGPQPHSLTLPEFQLSLAICYELSVSAHFNTALHHGVKVYLACAAKTQAGMEQSGERLRKLAVTHRLPTLLVNCIGPHDDFIAAGGSAVWNSDGQLVGQLDDQRSGLMVFDLQSPETSLSEYV